MKEGGKENRKKSKKSSRGDSKDNKRGWSKEKTVQARMKKKGE